MKSSVPFLGLVGLCLAATSSAFAATNDPLPAVDILLKRVVERSQMENENDRAFKQRYSFTRSKSTEHRNTSGDLKKRSAKTSVNTPAPPPTTPVIAVVGSGNGSGRPATSASATNDTSFDKKDLLLNTNILDRFNFTLAGREMVGGRPTLIVDFKPKSKKLPEPTLKDRFFNKAAGRIWVDEIEAVLVKAKHLTEKVNLLGGLVGAVNKATFSFDRQRTPEGLRYTPHTTWHLEVREVILNRVIDFEEKKTDIKKAW